MDIFILNRDFEAVTLVDGFISFVWTDRYNEAGEFQLEMPAYNGVVNDIQIGYYVVCELSDRMMIVESVQIETGVDSGARAVYSGRSLESILERRVVWGYYSYSGSLQTGLKAIITKNLINPSDTHRKIDGFQFEESDNTDVAAIQHEFAVFGDNIYELTRDICQANDIGFKVMLDSENHFVFSLYIGQNRSYNQELLPWVAFAPMFDNLISSRYFKSDIDYRTVSMVAGEKGEDESESSRPIVEATLSNGSEEEEPTPWYRRWGWTSQTETYTGGTGLDRREIYTDASGVSKTWRDDEGTEHTLTDAEYQKQLKDKGREELNECLVTQTFEGETDYGGQFVYGRDYQLGDILQLENEYGISCSVRVEEVVCTLDAGGLAIIPGFTAL